jgi:predicted O-methyltransferase YrrM
MLKIPFTKESRIDLIDLAIKKTKSKKYLEIGCDKNKVFNNVVCEHKVGVDPVRGGTHRMYSDEFFKQNTETFDVVFIDGLHYYEQVSKDLNNALECLNPNGIIILHDMLPISEEEAVIPIPVKKQIWLGDVWRLAFDLANRQDIEFKLVLIDNGCGIVFKTPTTKNKIEIGSTWEFYFNNWNKLPLISFEQIKKELL